MSCTDSQVGESRAALAPPEGTVFAEEVDRHLGALYRFALLWHEDRRDAEDLVVETVVATYRLWDAFSEDLPPRLRFFSVLRGHLEPREAEEEPPAPPPSRRDRAPENPETIPKVSREEAVRALRRLPTRYREMLTLRLGGGLGYLEIARIRGDDPGEVRKELTRAREALRGLFAPDPTAGAPA